MQLESFYYFLLNQGLEGFNMPKSWMEAFFQLEQLLIKLDNGSRQVVFIDELPWMDTPRSGFLPAFENFWNNWCSNRDNMMLIVCGSATSWILGNISRSKGGLYGRLTDEGTYYCSRQTIHLTMITTYGVAYDRHAGIVQKQVVMDDLFADK